MTDGHPNEIYHAYTVAATDKDGSLFYVRDVHFPAVTTKAEAERKAEELSRAGWGRYSPRAVKVEISIKLL